MASKMMKRAFGIQEEGAGALDRETVEERYKALEAVKAELVSQEKQLITRIEAYEKHSSSSASLHHGLDLEQKAALEHAMAAKSRSSSGKGRDLKGQQLELDLSLMVKQLQRSEDKVCKESKEWEAKAKDRAEAEARLKRKLASYPKKFMQSVEEVSKEVRALQDERDRLEGEVRDERARLFEEIQSLRTEVSVADTQLRRVEQELVETEEDRNFWMARYQKDKVRTDMLSKTRETLLERLRPLHGGRGLEKVVYDRVCLAVTEEGEDLQSHGGAEAYAGIVSKALSPFLEPEVSVSIAEVVQIVRVVATVAGVAPGQLTFDQFCEVVDQVEGKHWEMSA